MMMKLTCPECGAEINREECLETQFWDDTYYDTMTGKCPKCGQRYLWTDVYTYSRTEDFQKNWEIIEEENIDKRLPVCYNTNRK